MSGIITLGIESSCDDTAAAVLLNDEPVSNIVAGQEVHRLYGGVVPELASRSHQANIVPVVDMALSQAKILKKELTAIAFTQGPGLPGSLMVGTAFAKGLALALNIPLIAVNHMEAHIMAHFIRGSDIQHPDSPSFPFLCLTVSGGHTQMVLVKDYLDFETIGETIDDAAGEAFDKAARMLGLSYPGGPDIDRLARDGEAKFSFPKPQAPGLNFSFSGLKTAILYFLRKQTNLNPDFIKNNRSDLCASVQKVIIEILLEQVEKAAVQTGVREIALAGGVSANSHLRKKTIQLAESRNWKVFIPKMEYCTDNAAMIAITGYHKYLKGEIAPSDVSPFGK
jgi:N6-L-threonylcarbamoyladenine synthase